jgi:hypothetical protein
MSFILINFGGEGGGTSSVAKKTEPVGRGSEGAMAGQGRAAPRMPAWAGQHRECRSGDGTEDAGQRGCQHRGGGGRAARTGEGRTAISGGPGAHRRPGCGGGSERGGARAGGEHMWRGALSYLSENGVGGRGCVTA